MPTATETASIARAAATWTRVCSLDDIPPWCGVAALIEGRQIAILRWGETDQIHALGNFDPFSKAMVISRGIVGDCQGVPVIASPVYKQHFRLADGVCVEDPEVSLRRYEVRIEDGAVLVKA
jgi:nitrite reductase (NADH) small subunit